MKKMISILSFVFTSVIIVHADLISISLEGKVTNVYGTSLIVKNAPVNYTFFLDTELDGFFTQNNAKGTLSDIPVSSMNFFYTDFQEKFLLEVKSVSEPDYQIHYGYESPQGTLLQGGRTSHSVSIFSDEESIGSWRVGELVEGFERAFYQLGEKPYVSSILEITSISNIDLSQAETVTQVFEKTFDLPREIPVSNVNVPEPSVLTLVFLSLIFLGFSTIFHHKKVSLS